MKIVGQIKKQQSVVGEAGLVGQVVIEFLDANNKGGIEAMPSLQKAGTVIIEISEAQASLRYGEGG